MYIIIIIHYIYKLKEVDDVSAFEIAGARVCQGLHEAHGHTAPAEPGGQQQRGLALAVAGLERGPRSLEVVAQAT